MNTGDWRKDAENLASQQYSPSAHQHFILYLLLRLGLRILFKMETMGKP